MLQRNNREKDPFLSFDAHDLLQSMHHFHQICLVFHHLIDIFIRGRDFIDHTFIFPALNPLRLFFHITMAEPLLGLPTAHTSAFAMCTGIKRRRITLGSHDIRLRTHTAGYNSLFTLSCTDGAFTCQIDEFTEMFFECNIIMVTVDGFTGCLKLR